MSVGNQTRRTRVPLRGGAERTADTKLQIKLPISLKTDLEEMARSELLPTSILVRLWIKERVDEWKKEIGEGR